MGGELGLRMMRKKKLSTAANEKACYSAHTTGIQSELDSTSPAHMEMYISPLMATDRKYDCAHMNWLVNIQEEISRNRVQMPKEPY